MQDSKPTTPQPMTDEQIRVLYGDDNNFDLTGPYVIAFARAIESHVNAQWLARLSAQPVPSGEPVAAEFFAYHADMGVVFFKSEGEARECCAVNLREERKEANSTGEWNDDLAESIRYGVVLGKAKFFPDSDNPESGDYKMVDNTAPQAPSVPDDVRQDAERWNHAMDWATVDFAVCRRVGRTGSCWEPIKTSGPIDAAIAAAKPGGVR